MPIARRLGPAAGVIAVHAAIAYLLLAGLGRYVPGIADTTATRLLVFEPEAPPPPPPEPPHRAPKPREPGGTPAATPAPPLKAPPAPVTAPPAPSPIVPLPVATVPSGGGSPLGTGEGGSAGSGGGAGAGLGAGEADDPGFEPSEQIRGRFRNSDFPRELKRVGTVKLAVRYAVLPDGSVGNCTVIEPSGYPAADTMSCRVITERYRFRPARNGRGEAVTEVVEEGYRWEMDD